MNYWKNLLIAVDQLVNALIGGWPDETLSSRAYRMAADGNPWAMYAIDGLANLFGDENHCETSFKSERLRLQAPPETRRERETVPSLAGRWGVR